MEDVRNTAEEVTEEVEVEEVEEPMMTEEEILAKAKEIRKRRLKENAKKFGVAAACIGGGIIALIVKNSGKEETVTLEDGRELRKLPNGDYEIIGDEENKVE